MITDREAEAIGQTAVDVVSKIQEHYLTGTLLKVETTATIKLADGTRKVIKASQTRTFG